MSRNEILEPSRPDRLGGVRGGEAALPHAGYRIMPLPDAFTAAVGPYYARVDAGRPLIGLPLRDIHVSVRGYCHGAVITGLADLQSLAASYTVGMHDRFAATMSLTVDFIAPAGHGDFLELRTDLLRSSRQFLFTQALVVKADGALVARTSAVYKWDPAPHETPDIVRRLFEPSA
ncbi:PaaI family thioesterase [Prosthecomicrobium hirschii]|uniref:PaaI family thioesterase n=1 Tax=Prosthecodimorpha hirschii TaxID=665126 RepID=UPI00221F8796|nr:PaaI family thioesterase [Prosthecomicrobium hirschii]